MHHDSCWYSEEVLAAYATLKVDGPAVSHAAYRLALYLLYMLHFIMVYNANIVFVSWARVWRIGLPVIRTLEYAQGCMM